MISKLRQGEPRYWLRLQLFVSSFLPVLVLLALSVIAIEWIATPRVVSFVSIFVLCSLLTFVGNLAVTLLAQRTLAQGLMRMATTCQSFVSGDRTIRVSVQGNDEFAHLATALNNVLEDKTKYPCQSSSTSTPPSNTADSAREGYDKAQPVQLLHEQLDTLLKAISPVMTGDLRIHASVAPGIVGVVADTINYLIEELVQLIKRVQSGSDHIVSATRDLLDRAIELAQRAEYQMLHLSHTTESIETTTVFIQHLTRSLQLGLDATMAMQDEIERERKRIQTIAKPEQEIQEGCIGVATSVIQVSIEESPVLDSNNMPKDEEIPLLEKLATNLQKQRRILEGVSQPTQENTSIAETMVMELYTFAHHTHEATLEILNTAERISSLAVLANEWRSSIDHFSIPEKSRQ